MSLSRIVDDLKAAAESQKVVAASLLEYQAACVARDWPAVETARLKVIASTEAYLDNLAAAYKRMESA